MIFKEFLKDAPDTLFLGLLYNLIEPKSEDYHRIAIRKTDIRFHTAYVHERVVFDTVFINKSYDYGKINMLGIYSRSGQLDPDFVFKLPEMDWAAGTFIIVGDVPFADAHLPSLIQIVETKKYSKEEIANFRNIVNMYEKETV